MQSRYLLNIMLSPFLCPDKVTPKQLNHKIKAPVSLFHLELGVLLPYRSFSETTERLYASAARVVILFTDQEEARGVLTSARTAGLARYFTWVGSDGIGLNVDDLNDVSDVIHGALVRTLSWMLLFVRRLLSTLFSLVQRLTENKRSSIAHQSQQCSSFV